jgi:hypothetical protein
MYRAKRAGGNGFRHQGASSIGRRPPDVEGGSNQSIA